MATLAELRAFVTDIVPNDDSKFDNTDIDGYLNRCVNEIAAGTQSTLGDFVTPPLPNLFTIGTVNTVTSGAYVTMPADFQRGLQFAADEDGVELDISNSMIEFAEDYPLLDESGDIRAVIEHGGNLYYQGIPTDAEEVTLHYYKAPTTLTAVGDIPTSIPTHLHHELLVNYACMHMFQLLENGMAGPQVDTERYRLKYLSALRTLELSLPYYERSFFIGGES